MHGIDQKLRDHFRMLLMYSGYDGYFTLKEIALAEGVSVNTLKDTLQRIRGSHPDLMTKLRSDRASIKRATLRGHGLGRAKSFKPSMTAYIREKF